MMEKEYAHECATCIKKKCILSRLLPTLFDNFLSLPPLLLSQWLVFCIKNKQTLITGQMKNDDNKTNGAKRGKKKKREKFISHFFLCKKTDD